MGKKSRKGCSLPLLSPPCCVSGKLLSQNSSVIAIGYGQDLEGEGHAINTMPLIQNAIASSFIVVPILLFSNFFTCFFPPLINSC